MKFYGFISVYKKIYLSVNLSIYLFVHTDKNVEFHRLQVVIIIFRMLTNLKLMANRIKKKSFCLRENVRVIYYNSAS